MTNNGSKTLQEWDPEMFDSIEKEKMRQYRGLEMIASENFTSRAVMDCLGSALTNKYAEGEVGNRYYGGTEYVDEVESLTKARALKAFSLDPAVWGVNVQPYSGSPANFATYTGLLAPHSRIMGLDLPSGGHLTHGYYTAKKKISATSIFFESYPYHVDATGTIDYGEMERTAEVFRPALIIIGASAYTKEFDYPRVRKLCDAVGCIMMMDMAHTAGLIAGKAMLSPFDHCDVVTTTTHKSLRGPRSGLIFFRKVARDGTTPTDYETRINMAVFPGLQGGPHMHQIAAIGTQMKEVMSPEWAKYAQRVKANSIALAKALVGLGHTLVGGGTENHLCLWIVKAHAGMTGSKMEKLLDKVSISTNKNTVPGDKSALSPGGIRLGTCALTTRGMQEEDMKTVAGFLDRALRIAVAIQTACGETKKTVKDFVDACNGNSDIAALRAEVESFATKFPMPGFDVNTLKYKDGLK